MYYILEGYNHMTPSGMEAAGNLTGRLWQFPADIQHHPGHLRNLRNNFFKGLDKYRREE